ncbi:DEAD-box ATP-dependent RNA helicase [Vigna angularis]|uniref:DEAD-box ATP-dependent RNA helicase n=1 Tax=Phaseolus angularis TaxID=3914 RepID=A0A8T0LGM8_PHAAN|nr:DEAD-box ATP-dependent RNA helicase [Vigna angularis]
MLRPLLMLLHQLHHHKLPMAETLSLLLASTDPLSFSYFGVFVIVIQPGFFSTVCDVREGCCYCRGDWEWKRPRHKVLLILCPNVQLCEQVVRMDSTLRRDDGEAIVSVAAICGRKGWPIREPDVIGTTPAALLNYLDLDRTRRMEFMRGVKYVDTEEYLASHGLKNALYTIRAADLKEDVLGMLVPCPFQGGI